MINTATAGASQLKALPSVGIAKRERCSVFWFAAAVRKADRPGRRPWGGGGVLANADCTLWAILCNSSNSGSRSAEVALALPSRRSSKVLSRRCSCFGEIITLLLCSHYHFGHNVFADWQVLCAGAHAQLLLSCRGYLLPVGPSCLLQNVR